jgi:hypothetical protein
MNDAPLLIQNLRLTSENSVSRIVADVDGITVWYESSDVEMQRRGEIFACAFLLPAMKRGANLRIEGASLSPLWLSNAKQLMDYFSAWWGYTPITISSDTDWCPSVETPSDQHTGLFFTGGVDSFYSLLFPKEQIHDLVYVQGFDVGVNDQKRLEDTRQHLTQVATETGHRLILLKTNLREHPLIREMEWTKAHGGALASASYTLPGIRRMIISASDSGLVFVPWGTHPEIDPLWSNEQLAIVHQGTEAGRVGKLKALADHPLVQRHLRVCWKNAGRQDNCCRCEKCIRTMLILDSLDKLASFEAFPSQRGLFWRACQISSVPASSFKPYRDRLAKCPRWKTRLAMRIMLARSWFRNNKRTFINKLLGKHPL